MSELIQIWTDGSYRQQHNTMGGGWVIADEDGAPQFAGKRVSLPKLHDDTEHGSDIAELLAFNHALSSINPGSHVRVHMDCRNVADWIKNGEIKTAKKLRAPAVMHAFHRALTLKARMRSLEIVQISSDVSPNIRRANQLARAAATPGKDKYNGKPKNKKQRRRYHAYQNS